MQIITSIQGLPQTPFDNAGYVGINITNNRDSYFLATGDNLNNVINFRWFPTNPASISYTSNIVSVPNITQLVFHFRIIDNFLDICDRGGQVVFYFIDGTNQSFPVKTFGTLGRLWLPPAEGLITG